MELEFATSKTVREWIDEAFKHANETGRAIEKLEANSKVAREACADGITTRQYRDKVLASNSEAIENLNGALDDWLNEKSGELRKEIEDAFALNLSFMDAGRAAFLASCALTPEELSRFTRQAMATADMQTLRMLEANAARSGERYTLPVNDYIDAVVKVFDTAGGYARSCFIGDGAAAYLGSVDKIFDNFDKLLSKAEASACVPCA